MKNSLRWDNLLRTELAELAAQDAIVIIPLGATEQHGVHLPVGTDALIATAISERVAQDLREAGKPAVVAPTIAVANSIHHMDFCGTMTLQPNTYMEVLMAYCRSIKAHGFTKIAMINGHGGNRAPTEVALISIAEELGLSAYYLMYDLGSAKDYAQILESQNQIFHACECETSLMLYLFPHLVDPCYKEVKGGNITKEGRGGGPRPTGFQRFIKTTENGVLGNTYLATAEKGERLVAAMTTNLSAILQNDNLWAK